MGDEGFISKEHKEKITEEEANFIVDHAEKALKDTLENNNLIWKASEKVSR